MTLFKFVATADGNEVAVDPKRVVLVIAAPGNCPCGYKLDHVAMLLSDINATEALHVKGILDDVVRKLNQA